MGSTAIRFLGLSVFAIVRGSCRTFGCAFRDAGVRAVQTASPSRPPVRITLTTPAIKPSSRNTMRPQGEVDRQAIENPSRDPLRQERPPTSFGGEAKTPWPWRMPWPGPCPLRFPDGSVPIFRLSRISDKPVIQTSEPCGKARLRRRIDRDFPVPLSSVPAAML